MTPQSCRVPESPSIQITTRHHNSVLFASDYPIVVPHPVYSGAREKNFIPGASNTWILFSGQLPISLLEKTDR